MRVLSYAVDLCHTFTRDRCTPLALKLNLIHDLRLLR